MKTRIKNNDTILFIGDSITDCGRRDVASPLGNGYVKLFSDLLKMREPEKDVSIINKGISGNTVRDLKHRWSDDVLRHEFDWLSIKIGINDLHTWVGAPDQGVSPTIFAEDYREILERTKSQRPKARIILVDPFYISTDKSPHSMRARILKDLDQYLSVVQGMSREFGTLRVRTHEAFQKLLKYHEPDLFCPEPVHPYTNGHLVIAESIYAALI